MIARGAGTLMFSLDNLVADFRAGFRQWLSQLDEDAHHSYGTVEEGLAVAVTSDRLDGSLLSRFVDTGGYANLPPVGGSTHEALSDAARRGFKIHFYASRPASVETDTRRWLINRFGSIPWTVEVGSGTKCGGHRFAGALDTNPVNVKALADTGCPNSMLLTQPWNIDSQCRRVDTVAQFVGSCLNPHALADEAADVQRCVQHAKQRGTVRFRTGRHGPSRVGQLISYPIPPPLRDHSKVAPRRRRVAVVFTTDGAHLSVDPSYVELV